MRLFVALYWLIKHERYEDNRYLSTESPDPVSKGHSLSIRQVL